MDHAHRSEGSSTASKIALGAAGSVIAAPYILPLVGLGSSQMTRQIVTLCQTSAGNGIGAAGAINGLLGHIPGIGSTLAAGGWANAFASGILGIGGVLLGNYVEKHFDKPGHLPWGKIIKYAAIGTSMLIALPSLLSGLSMGLTFLTFAAGNLFGGATLGASMASTVSGALGSSLGLMGGINVVSAGAGLTGLLAHVVTCGAAALPVVGSLWLGHASKDQPRQLPRTVLNGPLSLEGRVSQPSMAMAHA